MGLRLSLAKMIGGKSLNAAVANSLSSFMQQGMGAPRRGTKELLNAYSNSPWLRAVTSKIAFHMASVPYCLYIMRGVDGAAIKSIKTQVAGFDSRKKLLTKRKDEIRVQEILDHPFLDLMANPNKKLNSIAVRRLTSIYLDLKGECFLRINRGAMDQPIELWPIEPNLISELPTDNNPFFKISINNIPTSVKQENIIWIKDPDPTDPYGHGTGIAEALRDELDTDEYAASVAKNVFFNKGMPDAIITVEGGTEGTEAAKATFEQRYRGFQNANRTMFTNSKVSVEKLSQSFADMELMNLRSWERDTFVSVYGVPPEILGLITSSNRATIKEATTIFAREVLIPRIELERAELQKQLIPLFDDRLILDYENPIPDDDEFELKAMTAAPHMATRAEWRNLQGLENRGEIDNVHIVPLNFIEVKPGENSNDVLSGANNQSETEPTKSKALTIKAGIDDVILSDLKAEYLSFEVKPLWEDNIEEWGGRVLSELGITTPFAMTNPLIRKYIENFLGYKIKGINETTKDALKKQINEAISAGEGNREIANRVKDVFNIADSARARMIARTEVNSAANFSQRIAFKVSGVVSGRQWVSVRDGNVRDEHAELEGQIVGIDEPFVIDGMEGMGPGEFGDPEMDINCRCTTIAVIGDNVHSEAVLTAHWKSYDRKLIPWEKQTIKAFQRGFKKQESSILEKINQLFPVA